MTLASPHFQLHWLMTRSRLLTFAVSSGLISLGSLGFAPDRSGWVQFEFAGTIAAAQVAPNSINSSIQLIYVSPNTGNDQGAGTERSPLQTITEALRRAASGTAIILAPGTYSTQTGEQFPLILQPNVTIQGNPNTRGRGIVIYGGGYFVSPSFARQNIAVLAASGAGLKGVTVTNPNDRGYGLWVESSSLVISDNTFTNNTHDGISVVGSGAPLIQNNHFTQNGANGITAYGTSRPEIRNNEFQNTGFGINVAQKSAPFISGNRITFNKDGVVVQAQAQPILRDNYIERNQRDGIVAIANARPDLGTAGEPGRNLIQGNGRYDIHNGTKTQSIRAYGNQLATTKGIVQFGNGSSGEPIRPLINQQLASRVDESQRNDPSAISPVNTAAALPVFQPDAQATQRNSARSRTRSRTNPPQLNRTVSRPPSEPGLAITVPPPESRRTARRSSRIPRVSRSQTPQSPASQSQAPTTYSSNPASSRSDSAKPAAPAPSSSILARLLARPSGSTSSTPDRSNAVTIPVPPPESANSAPPVPPPTVASSGNLPVPAANIPISGEGYIPTGLESSNPQAAQSGTRQLAPLSSTFLGLQYRVVVEGDSESLYQRVRTVVPEAFRTVLQGRSVIQAGAFRSHSQANRVMQRLSRQGITAKLESFN
ncbi:MAG: DUF1565 domain-containing protein [Microcoleaceae cyanobacterium]